MPSNPNRRRSARHPRPSQKRRQAEEAGSSSPEKAPKTPKTVVNDGCDSEVVNMPPLGELNQPLVTVPGQNPSVQLEATSSSAAPTRHEPVGSPSLSSSLAPSIIDHQPVRHSGQGVQTTDQDIRNLDLVNLGRSPINVQVLLKYLDMYENKANAKILSEGFQKGFKINYEGPRSAREAKNLKSATQNQEALMQKINNEISLGRIAGPFTSCPISNLIVSPVGLIPKSQGGFRMITHLSYPEGTSINSGIDQVFCTVQYTSFDKVTSMIYNLGKSAFLGKRDLKSAYRLLPISPTDFQLFGIKVGDNYYVDKCMAMGLSQSANLFEKFSTFLHWTVARQSNLDTLDHLLDDFIFAGPKDSDNCQRLIDTFEKICKELGIPIADEKSVNPTTVLVFLGLEIDTNQLSVRIPGPRLIELQELLLNTCNKTKVTLKELQSLVGKLSFFGKAIRSSRAFLRRFYDAMAPLKKSFHRLRITREMRLDIQLWLEFLKDFNGITYIPEDRWFSDNELHLFSDSAGSKELGAGCFFDNEWCFFKWPQVWASYNIHKDITFLEMVPVVLAMYLWGKDLADKKLTLHIDNEALVCSLNKQTSKSKRLMQLIRPFVLLAMQKNVIFRAVHIPSKSNAITDAISRCQWDRFRQLAPAAQEDPRVIPQKFHLLISSLRLEDC